MMSQAPATAADQQAGSRQLWTAAALLPLFFSSSREEQTDATSGQKKLTLFSRRTSSSLVIPHVKENRIRALPSVTVGGRRCPSKPSGLAKHPIVYRKNNSCRRQCVRNKSR
jgi:hypothetical protein